jgi:hypothetical protein
MNSAPAPNVIVKARVSVTAPAIVVAWYPSMTEFARPTATPPAKDEVQEYSPPELYTLHAALLI